MSFHVQHNYRDYREPVKPDLTYFSNISPFDEQLYSTFLSSI